MKITFPKDSDSLPKKRIIKDFNLAFASGNIEAILSMVSEDIVWEMVGGSIYKSKTEMAKALTDMKLSQASELNVDNIISHGNKCASNGSMSYGESKIAFCDIYTFENFKSESKISHLVSYGVELT